MIDAESTDAALLAAADPAAFDLLVRRHSARLWAVALRTTGDPEEAADALQEALLSAYRRAETFRGESAVTTWLHRIVVNACLDRLRRRAARPTVALVEDHPGLPQVADGTAGIGLRDAVHSALAALPDDQRVALVLVDMEGYPLAEVAALLGVAEGTVKSRCSRGRARLRPLLARSLAESDLEVAALGDDRRNLGRDRHVPPVQAGHDEGEEPSR